VDLQDEPKRKNQFWMIVAETTLLVQASTPYDKQMWLDDLARWFPKSRREGKKQKHEELLERQKKQDEKSLREREERKQLDPNSFNSATEIPKDYVPEEQMKITRGQSGRGKTLQQGGSSLIDLQLPGRIPDSPTSPNSPSSFASSFTSSSTNSSISPHSEMCITTTTTFSSIDIPTTISSSKRLTPEHSPTSNSNNKNNISFSSHSTSSGGYSSPNKKNLDSPFKYTLETSCSSSPSKQEYPDRIGKSSLTSETGYLHFVIKAD